MMRNKKPNNDNDNKSKNKLIQLEKVSIISNDMKGYKVTVRRQESM